LAKESLRIQRRSGGAPIVSNLSFPPGLFLAEDQDGKDGQLQGIIVVTYEIRVFFEGAQKEVFSSIFLKKL
jgi:hypothetical protein